MKTKNHGTGIPGKTYLDSFLSECSTEIALFKRTGSTSLTWPQKILMENAYIETGGHAFDKNCSTCVVEVLKRIIDRTAELTPKTGKAPEVKKITAHTVEPREKTKPKLYMNKYNSEELTDGTVIYWPKGKTLEEATEEIFIFSPDPELGEILPLAEGSYTLANDQTELVFDHNGHLVQIITPEYGETDEDDERAEGNTFTRERREQLKALGFVEGEGLMHHQHYTEVSVTDSDIENMPTEGWDVLLETLNEEAFKNPPASSDLFVATEEHTNAQLSQILTDRGVKHAKKATKTQLIELVNGLKLPKSSVKL